MSTPDGLGGAMRVGLLGGPVRADPLAQPPPAGVDQGDAGWTWRGLRLDGLAPRVVAYLTLALLPLGLIALYQTREFQQETEERAELSLLALTRQGAEGVGSAIERGLGASEVLTALPDVLDDPDRCSAILSRLVEGDGPFSFVGFLPAEGAVTCSSRGEPFELEGNARAELADLLANPRLAIRASSSRDDVLVLGIPMAGGEEGGAPTGYLALSIPHDRIQPPPTEATEIRRPRRLLTFNSDGQILTGRATGDQAMADLLPAGEGPDDRGLASRVTEVPQVFTAQSEGGAEQVYTVAPLVPGVAYAMGVWSPEQAGQGTGDLRESPLLFPLLMWAVSLAVAFWALHRLVIGRVRELVAAMHRFGRDRSLPDRPPEPGTPFELREIDQAFRQMGDSILQDEARMEHAFRERGVLLREVHHRVKNNLQLISSIISMQLRRLPEPTMRAILRRLQDRVLTLASIYRSLYTSPDMGDVNAAPVIRAIVEQELRSAEGRVEATLDIEDLVLDPDKVVPLAFLAAEAVSNALSRAGSLEGRPSLSVSFHRDGDRATLSIGNSLAGLPEAGGDPGRGVGQHLINAFASQVGGPVEIDASERLYRLSVTFPAMTEDAEVEHA